MAQHVETFLVDDLTGERTDDGRTVEFGFDGKTYEIDLSQENAEKFRDVLREYVEAARVIAGRPSRRASKASSVSPDRERNQAIREWARERGIKVSERGRIAQEVIDAYEGRPGPAYPNLSDENKEKLGYETAPKRSLKVVEAPDDSLTATDQEVIAWMKSKGFKIPTSNKPSAPMRARYRKEVLGQTG